MECNKQSLLEIVRREVVHVQELSSEIWNWISPIMELIQNVLHTFNFGIVQPFTFQFLTLLTYYRQIEKFNYLSSILP